MLWLQISAILICTCSGWIETISIWTEKAQEVTKVFLQEIIPWYVLPITIGSDNGLAFRAEITQTSADLLKIKWHLHTAYRPQKSGKVEYMNHTLKVTLAKSVRKLIYPGLTCWPWPYGKPDIYQDHSATLSTKSCLKGTPEIIKAFKGNVKLIDKYDC